MKNPLAKRLPREFRADLGKYAVIFLFMVMLISLVSGFLVADNSMIAAYNEGFEKYNIEHGHIAFDKEPPAELLERIESEAGITLYDLRYFEENIGDTEKLTRVYINRGEVDKECLMSGSMPSADNEIAIDRMFANNNGINVGDTISVRGRELTVSGFAAFSDYSSLYRSNTDMMFDALGFNVGVMTKEGFEAVGSSRIHYNYAWKYNTEYDRNDKARANELSEDLIGALEDVLTEYDENIVKIQTDALAEKLEKAGEEYGDIYKAAFEKKIEEVTEIAGKGGEEYAAYYMMNGTAPSKSDLSVDTDDFIFGIIEKSFSAAIRGEEYEGPSEEEFRDAYLDTVPRPSKEQLSAELDDFLFGIVDAAAQAEINGEEYEMPGDEEFEGEIDKTGIIGIDDYVPLYLNKAVNFAGEDMGSDKAMFIMFAYIVIIVLAFIFAVTTSNTIVSEAGVIGTLRASGYSRGELTAHYLVLPVAVTLFAAVIGNILGYTYFKNVMADMYYNSYSLASYTVLWNADAFITTTLVPIALMFVINLLVISSKMRLTPLQFLRRELKKNSGKKAFRLNTKIPFPTRFKLRIIFQNMANYIIMTVGIIIGAVVIIFGDMFGTIFKDYSKTINENMICEYQYIVADNAETENGGAEKFSMTSFEFQYKDYAKDEISVYGIEENSRYIGADVSGRRTAVSSTVAAKYGISAGGSITLDDPYSRDKSYTLTVDSVYDYEASLAIFISRESYCRLFGGAAEDFTGYFSNETLDDIDEDDVIMTITANDFTKLSDQMEHSMGDMMKFFGYFGIIMFALIMYILSKQVIERNFQSISMCKILGFRDSEIGSMYILSTSAVVVIGLLIAVPLTDGILRWAFSSYLYKVVTGYFPFNVRPSSYVKMIILGIVSYAAVAGLQLIKINRVPKGEALKNRE